MAQKSNSKYPDTDAEYILVTKNYLVFLFKFYFENRMEQFFSTWKLAYFLRIISGLYLKIVLLFAFCTPTGL